MTRLEHIEETGQVVLDLLNRERETLMATVDRGAGLKHSHGEVDNARGLKIRAISVSITNLETALMWANRGFDEQ